jgi:uncharacterized protein (DUF302 family)
MMTRSINAGEALAPAPQYGHGIRLRGMTMAQARAEVSEALAAEGFGVLTEIDVQATLEQKLGVKVAPYLILGACNPALARLALEIEPYTGLFLPCNVTLWPDGDEIVVTVASPVAMLGVVDDARLAGVAREAERRLHGALERIVV